MTTTGADLIGRHLRAAGATHAFGIPGGEVLALMQGLDAAGLRFHLVKHENAGGFMAEGLWHATGALPVLLATIGPGVTNAVNVVANALQDRVPLIFLTGCVDAAEAETFTHQVMDHQALLRPITKGSFRLVAGAVGAGMAKAIQLALSGQPGPVHVDVPTGVAEGRTTEPAFAPLAPATPGRPAAAALSAALGALATARRPLALAGVDAVNEAAGPQIAAFCRAHAIPLITTYKAKGLMPETDPLCLGAAGLSPKADRLLLPLIATADAVLLLGYDPIEMRIGWRNPFPPGQTVIEVAPVLRTHAMHHATHTLTGTLAETLPALAHATPPRWPDASPATARTALRAAFRNPDPAGKDPARNDPARNDPARNDPARNDPAGNDPARKDPAGADPSATDPWGPHAVFRTFRATTPPETVITADSGAHRILVSQMWDCQAPRQMLQSSGLCTMACAVPLAMGAKLGRPGVPVVAFVGDAGLDMGAGELATLRDLGLPLILCVLADAALTLIEMKQRGSQRPPLGVDFGLTDFPALARAYGGHGAWVDDTATLAAEIAAALQRPSFSLIAARIAKGSYDGAF